MSQKCMNLLLLLLYDWKIKIIHLLIYKFLYIKDFISLLNNFLLNFFCFRFFADSMIKSLIIIIIIINSYTLVTSIKSIHEKLYAICIKWTKLSEVENHSQFTWLLHAVETVSFETMYQICSHWLHIRERVF